MELLDQVEVSVDEGIAGDFRGRVKPGGRGRRQVSLMEAGDWATAMRELGTELPWQTRRANLLVQDFDLPQREGVHLRIGAVLLRITVECDSCKRMDELHPGLMNALLPDWRGGALARVVQGGRIAIGDPIILED